MKMSMVLFGLALALIVGGVATFVTGLQDWADGRLLLAADNSALAKLDNHLRETYAERNAYKRLSLFRRDSIRRTAVGAGAVAAGLVLLATRGQVLRGSR